MRNQEIIKIVVSALKQPFVIVFFLDILLIINCLILYLNTGLTFYLHIQ